ncbi:MAG: GntP family permease, partial [Treponema sp.]|nr:GntP family permease [Treponema sp.]
MVAGTQLVAALIIGIAVLIFLVLTTKIHAFFALIISSLVIGLIAGLKFGDITGAITGGFGGTLGSIGIIIGFGVMMGEIFQFSGAANRMAHTFVKLFGKGREEWALAATGFLVSIPVFCDSGFVILSPIAKALSRQTKKSMIALGTALAAGLVVTHANVPPTPGPLFVVGQFGIDLGKFILISLAASIPMVICTTLYAKWLGRRIYQVPSADGEGWDRPPYQEPVYGGILAEEKDMPNAFVSFLPIVLPIILILLGTIFNALKITEGTLPKIIQLVGTPIVAVGIGLFCAIYTLAFRIPRKELLAKMETGIKSAGIIILVTGGGGALGRVLQTSG